MALCKAECKSHSVRSYNDVSVCYQLPCAEIFFYIVIYITGKTHEGVVRMSKATKLNRKYNKSCHDFTAFHKIDIKIFIQN